MARGQRRQWCDDISEPTDEYEEIYDKVHEKANDTLGELEDAVGKALQSLKDHDSLDCISQLEDIMENLW